MSSPSPAFSTPPPKLPQRQTRIQEHLKTVKPFPSSSASHRLLKIHSAASAPKMKKASDEDHAQPGEQELSDYTVIAVKPKPQLQSSRRAILEIGTMPEEEVYAQLDVEKVELRKRLATLGLNPQSETLDRALQALSDKGEVNMTMDSFLETLSSVDNHSIPPLLPSFQPRRSSPPSIAASPEYAYASFSTLESPSTPSLLHSSSSSSNRRRTSSTPSLTPREPTTPIQTPLAPQALSFDTPIKIRTDRLRAFDADPAQSSATLNKSSALVTAELGAMGRVIISRNILVETFGRETTESVINAAAVAPAPTVFGQSLARASTGLQESLPILESFADRSRFVRKDEQMSAVPLILDERMNSIRQWLDSPEMVEEDSRDSWSFVPKEWDRELDQRAGEVLVMSDVGEDEGREEIRVGGKGVKVLLRSKKRRAEDTVDRHAAADTTPATPTMKKARPSFAGPILVETHFTPQSKGNFYRTAQPDMALAPSPQTSPATSRRQIPIISMSSPTRPSHTNAEASSSAPRLPLPVTPKLDRRIRADYSPRSPLFYRSGRNRAISGHFDDSLPYAQHWTTVDEGERVSRAATGLLAPIGDDESHPKSWHDLTSTPSRSLCSATLGGRFLNARELMLESGANEQHF